MTTVENNVGGNAMSGPRLAMLAAIAIHFASQFQIYVNDPGSEILLGTTDYDRNTIGVIGRMTQVAGGWQLHPQAYVILPVLAICFIYTPIARSDAFRLFGYWAAVALLFWAWYPALPFFTGSNGAQIGGVALLIALGAAIANLRGGLNTPSATVAASPIPAPAPPPATTPPKGPAQKS